MTEEIDDTDYLKWYAPLMRPSIQIVDAGTTEEESKVNTPIITK